MAGIPDSDRDRIFNTINSGSNKFTEQEIEQIHEIAIMLDEIRQSIINREDTWGQ